MSSIPKIPSPVVSDLREPEPASVPNEEMSIEAYLERYSNSVDDINDANVTSTISLGPSTKKINTATLGLHHIDYSLMPQGKATVKFKPVIQGDKINPKRVAFVPNENPKVNKREDRPEIVLLEAFREEMQNANIDFSQLEFIVQDEHGNQRVIDIENVTVRFVSDQHFAVLMRAVQINQLIAEQKKMEQAEKHGSASVSHTHDVAPNPPSPKMKMYFAAFAQVLMRNNQARRERQKERTQERQISEARTQEYRHESELKAKIQDESVKTHRRVESDVLQAEIVNDLQKDSELKNSLDHP